MHKNVPNFLALSIAMALSTAIKIPLAQFGRIAIRPQLSSLCTVGNSCFRPSTILSTNLHYYRLMAYRPRPVSTKSRKILPLIDLPAKEQFRQNISRLIVSTMSLSATSGATDTGNLQLPVTPGLRKLSPYWYPYTTYAKQRWIGRELLEVISTEFRDRSVEYYVSI